MTPREALSGALILPRGHRLPCALGPARAPDPDLAQPRPRAAPTRAAPRPDPAPDRPPDGGPGARAVESGTRCGMFDRGCCFRPRDARRATRRSGAAIWRMPRRGAIVSACPRPRTAPSRRSSARAGVWAAADS